MEHNRTHDDDKVMSLRVAANGRLSHPNAAAALGAPAAGAQTPEP
jgi:hypothetical protein